jgi:hypothetical protein
MAATRARRFPSRFPEPASFLSGLEGAILSVLWLFGSALFIRGGSTKPV